MNIMNLTESCDQEFIAQVERESGQNVSLCYQCGNCTAGCPFNFAYDIPVNQIMRLLQNGQKEAVLSCRSIWLCATCESCTTRCPNNIDVARIMDVLRHMARREGRPGVKNVKVFWDSFLGSVEKHGRAFEMGLMASYALKTGDLFSQADLGPKMLPKNKLGFRPHTIKGKDEVAKIFQRFKQEHGS